MAQGSGKCSEGQAHTFVFVCDYSLLFDLHHAVGEGEFRVRGGTTARRGSGEFLFTTVTF